MAGSLKHLMRPGQVHRGACDGERLCRLAIEDQLERPGSLDGSVDRRGALPNLVYEDGGALAQVEGRRALAQQVHARLAADCVDWAQELLDGLQGCDRAVA